MEQNTKVCTKCGKEYPATKEFFHTKKSVKCGLRANCKKCASDMKKNYYSENQEKRKEQIEATKKWRANNTERTKQASKTWRNKNPEIAKYNAKKWRENNKEKVIENWRKWNEINSEIAREKRILWRKKNYQKVIEYKIKTNLKQQLGFTPPQELLETKIIHLKIKRLCKTLKN